MTGVTERPSNESTHGAPAERDVVIVTFDSGQILDVTGPLEVFSSASRFLPAVRYRTQVVTTRGGSGARQLRAGVRLVGDRRRRRSRRHLDGGRWRRHGRSGRRQRAARPDPAARCRRTSGHLGLLRRLPARGRRPARGSSRDHPLGRLRSARRRLTPRSPWTPTPSTSTTATSGPPPA